MNRYLITSVAALFLSLALVALVEIIWNQEPEQPAIETPAATTTPTPPPTGPLTIQITGLEGAESIDDVWAVIEIPRGKEDG
nr:MAG TPA: cutinase [Bacteriophage sp.]